jgi:hypothetical protein
MPAEALRRAYYRLPDSLQRAVLVKRRESAWIAAGIVFIHIPKAAGTSINDALYGQFMGHVRAADIRRCGSPRLKALPSFAVTRNPWDRLVSAYRFATAGRGTGGRIQAGVRDPQQYRIPEFESFQRFVTDWLCHRDPARLDPIFQPQHLYVAGGGSLLVDHLGRLDDLGPTLDFIERHLGSRPSIERSNLSGNSVDYRDFYTPALTRTVAEIYRTDVDLFGYRF